MHVAFFAERVGLTPEQVAATCGREAEADVLPARERLLIRLADALHDEAQVREALWTALRQEWTEPQLVELVALVGFYHLISFVANALRIPPEPYGARFPHGADRRRSPPASPGGAS